MVKVGITERGDAGLDFSWERKLLPANIIISKELNDKLIEKLVKNKDKIIFHMTCTGLGGTVIEPHVPSIDWTYKQFYKLYTMGFPVSHVVLRVDPVIPVEYGINAVNNVLSMFSNTGIKRVRYSFVDMYPHARKRFNLAHLPLPYGNNFEASEEQKYKAMDVMRNYNDIYTFEACAENNADMKGCISETDLEILGITESISDYVCGQRKLCLCPQGKTELLSNNCRCSHGCLYCYWKDA